MSFSVRKLTRCVTAVETESVESIAVMCYKADIESKKERYV